MNTPTPNAAVPPRRQDRHNSGIFFEVWQKGLGATLVIGDQHVGYRIAGPKLGPGGGFDSPRLLRRAELDDHDIKEIRRYLTQAKRNLSRKRKP